MAASKYIITGTTHFSNGTESIVLKKDKDGNVTKEISATKPVTLTNDDLKLVRSLGVTVEKISAADASALEAQKGQFVVGADTAGAAPVFETPNS